MKLHPFQAPNQFGDCNKNWEQNTTLPPKYFKAYKLSKNWLLTTYSELSSVPGRQYHLRHFQCFL